MIDTKKEQERDELHRAIWAIADELRGAVDGWDFKNYVLGTMFYRYISENLCSYINNGEITTTIYPIFQLAFLDAGRSFSEQNNMPRKSHRTEHFHRCISR